jgi:Tfp pilus assembly protein PilF
LTSLKSIVRKGLAFCTILLAAMSIAQVGHGTALSDSYSDYREEQIARGAQTFPLAAQLLQERALRTLQEGDPRAAEKMLVQASEMDPNYPDPYFTLAKIKARQLSSDTFYYLTRAVATLLDNFRYQRLLVLNGILFTVLGAALIALIFCIAFTLKYLPFTAHKLAEILERRGNIALPKLSAYLLLVIPFALFPGLITGLSVMILISWMYMLRREKLITILIILPFLGLGFFDHHLQQYAPLADPTSLTSRIAAANDSPGDDRLIAAIEAKPAGALAVEKDLALGLLHLRSEQFLPAATYFLRAISKDPENLMAYVNLGNVYYLQGDYEKALEGYRKASALDSLDAVCQYNLAQAYIKTFLLAESSDALKRASASGIDEVKKSFASKALKYFPVYPKTFSDRDLWRISMIEGETYMGGHLWSILLPITRFTPRLSAWLLTCALLLSLLFLRMINRRKLAFQCANCGELTCDGCCKDEDGRDFCESCAEAVEGVSSEKVISALLRRRRQAVIVKRRKSVRLLTSLVPGVRDIYYGRIMRGAAIAALFSFSLILLWSRGMIIQEWNTIATQVPAWKLFFYAGTGLFAIVLSIFSKPPYDSKALRVSGNRGQVKEHRLEDIPSGAAV